MKTGKRRIVLIALDYDPTAQKVAEKGYSMAKAMNAEVILLHVISAPLYYSSVGNAPIMGLTDSMGVDPLLYENMDRLKTVSQNFLDNSKKHLGDKTIQTLLEEGDFAESILRVAKELDVDVIVVGSHSRKWLEYIVMGSVTEMVLNHTEIPLFIIPIKKHN